MSSLVERRQCGFLFRHDSFNDFYIHFSFLGQCCVFEFAVYRSLSSHVWFEVSGFPVFSDSVIVLGICWCVCWYIYWWIFKVRKTTILCYCPNLVSEPLVCCLKSSEFSSDFYHSFSIPSFFWVAPKIKV